MSDGVRTRRPFDAKEIAEQLNAGNIVGLGTHVLLRRTESDIVHFCRLCEATMSIPCDPGAAALADDAIAFIKKHQHPQGASS